MRFNDLARHHLKWVPDLALGYYEVEPIEYDKSYFDKYVSYEGTEICNKLNKYRVDWVKQHFDGEVLDIGIGCGSFINAHGNAKGYDINPAGIEWLNERGLYKEPKQVEAVAFWDSFEHIEDPAEILNEVTGWVFMSIPLFDHMYHVLESKHFRKDEHYWYFTFNGLCKYMALHGFDFVSFCRMESDAGREDIGTFAFKRIK